MIGSATFKAMMDAGLTDEQKLAIIEGLEADRKPKDATNAARQARHREKKRGQSNGVTVTRYPPNDIISNPPSPSETSVSSGDTSVISDEMTSPAANGSTELRPEHVLEAWNVMADRTGVPKAKLTPERRKKLLTFVRRHPIDDITEAIFAIERSPFLRGENDRAWKADFNWMLEPRNFTKLIEGTYDRTTH